jgi:hypothetical protein
VLHGVAPDVKRVVRKSSRTATRIGRGTPPGVIKCNASGGALPFVEHSSPGVRCSRILVGQEIRLQRDPDSGFERADQRVAVVGAERPLHGHGLRCAGRVR